MEIKQEKIPGSKVRLEITISQNDFAAYEKEALKAFSRELKVDGFRPGNIPEKIVREKVGQNNILQEASDLAVRDTYLDALQKEKLEPLGSPEVKIVKLAPGNDFVYQVEISVLPDIALPDYKKIAQKIVAQKGKEKIEVKEEEIKKSLDWLVDSRSKLVTVKRPAKKGDRVEVDFEVSQNGVPIENGQSQNHPLVIGEGGFVPGFEDNIEGMKEAEEKDFSLKFPADYHEKSLAGKQADFKVKLKLVQEKDKPELNDEFASTLGQFKSLADLKKSIIDGLTKEKEGKKKEEIRMAIVTEIAKKMEVKLPEILIENELNKMKEEFKAQVTQMGMEFDKYLQSVKKTEDDLVKDWKEKAEQRVRIGLLLQEIAKKEEIEPTEKEIEEEASKALKAFANVSEAKNNIDTDRLRQYTKGVIINEKVFELLEGSNDQGE